MSEGVIKVVADTTPIELEDTSEINWGVVERECVDGVCEIDWGEEE